jgi:hypothetical protein
MEKRRVVEPSRPNSIQCTAGLPDRLSSMRIAHLNDLANPAGNGPVCRYRDTEIDVFLYGRRKKRFNV